MLWRCWLGGRKGIQPVKNWVVECWHGYLSGARCRLAYGPSDATATHSLLLQLNPDWFFLSGAGSPGSPRKRAVKWVCVCMCRWWNCFMQLLYVLDRQLRPAGWRPSARHSECRSQQLRWDVVCGGHDRTCCHHALCWRGAQAWSGGKWLPSSSLLCLLSILRWHCEG